MLLNTAPYLAGGFVPFLMSQCQCQQSLIWNWVHVYYSSYLWPSMLIKHVLPQTINQLCLEGWRWLSGHSGIQSCKIPPGNFPVLLCLLAYNGVDALFIFLSFLSRCCMFATWEFSRVYSKIIKVYSTHFQINILKYAHKICCCSPNASSYIKLHINTSAICIHRECTNWCSTNSEKMFCENFDNYLRQMLSNLIAFVWGQIQQDLGVLSGLLWCRCVSKLPAQRGSSKFKSCSNFKSGCVFQHSSGLFLLILSLQLFAYIQGLKTL